jgi:hypothetical protein
VTWDRSIGPRCNIGPAEIARRRRSATAFTAAAIAVAVGLLAIEVPPVTRLAIFPFATAAGITWAQVVHKFCVAFGALGVENFGPLGEAERVDSGQRAEDRRRAVQLVLEGVAVGFAATVVLVAVAP